MSTVREMSEDYLKTVYELCIFLRLNGHGPLGERIMTAAVEVATLSHTTWSNLSQDGFFDNLVKTHEMADKLSHIIDLVEYLALFILVFSALATVALEFIDKDRR